MSRVEEIVRDFARKQKIRCAETIYQTDWVIENAYELIDKLVTELDCWYREEDEGNWDESVGI